MLILNFYIISIYISYNYYRQSYVSYRTVYYYTSECCSGYALVNGQCRRKTLVQYSRLSPTYTRQHVASNICSYFDLIINLLQK